MKQKHVVVRFPGAGRRSAAPMPGAELLGSGTEMAPKKIAVEFDDLSQSDVDKVRRGEDVLAVAPAMPMRLVAPRDVSAAPAAAGVDWGVHAVGADTSPFTGDGVTVAVLDTGIDETHPAFAGVKLVRRNFTDDAVDSDQHGHGTHCAGTVFGRDVEGTRIGVARGIKKAFIGKVLGASGGGSSEQIVSAIQWAVEQQATVISMSLGMDFPGYQKMLMETGLPPEIATSRALEGYRSNVLLFERLASTIRAMAGFGRATLLVAAAGNESQADVNPDFKVAVSPPAVSEGVLSVAALGRSPAGLTVASFSNTGAMVAGPGVGITSAKSGGGLTAMSGTSMATPNVAGVTALWAEKLLKSVGSLNPALLSARLVGSGVMTGLAPGVDAVDVGAGLVRAPQN